MVSIQDSGTNWFDLKMLGILRNKKDTDEDEEEECPTHLNTLNSSGGFCKVSTDKLSVQYLNTNLHGHDVGIVQANRPAPVRRLVYYFEMLVQNAGQKGQVSIGFTNENYRMRRQPGWDANSIGYHGDDGLIYRGPSGKENLGVKYATGDTVGSGINYASQEIFFTKNGKLVGSTTKDIKGPMYPTIAVHSQNEEVFVNFGQRPFTFDIEGYKLRERQKQQKTIENMSLPLDVSHWIVRSYLLHYGYQETLNSFDLANKNTLPPILLGDENGCHGEGDMYALTHRRVLRELIRSGDIDSAFGKLKEWYPSLLQNDTSTLCFLLHGQKFIELIRDGNLAAAVEYGQAELAKFFGLAPFAELLQDCIALLAYEGPEGSPVGYLLEMTRREIVADAVNSMIFSTNPCTQDLQNCLNSRLERLMRQLAACSGERRALSGGQGEVFQLHRVINKW